MNFNIDVRDNTMLVEISGELDDHAAKTLRDKLDFYLMRKEIVNLIFDLVSLTLMDSAGIGLLIGRYKQIKERNGRAIIIPGESNARKILKMSGVFNLYKEAKNLEDAFEMLGHTKLA